MRPLKVWRETAVWHWTCRVPLCDALSWEFHHGDALMASLDHLKRHNTFGFR